MEAKVKLPSAIARQQKRVEELLTAQQTTEQQELPLEVETPPKVSTVVQPLVAPRREDTAEYWKHRFDTLEGIAKADKARLAGDLSQSQARLQSQEDRLKVLEGQLTDIERKTPRKFDLRNYLSEEEIETLDGQQLQAAIKVAVGASSEEIEERIKKHVGPIAREIETSKQALIQQRIDSFWAGLTAAVPSWQEVNANTAFHEWLYESDVFTGEARQSSLENAQNSLDLKRVVAIFNTFIKETKASDPTSRLERKIQPESRMPQPTAGDVDGDVYVTRSQIKEHYNRSVNGYYKSRPREKDEMERRINIAQANGNILDR